jgi:hypothetical protein
MWAKFDDQFYLNPKNASMDRDEQDIYMAGIVYCNGQLTDGFIPTSTVKMLCAWAKLPDKANAQAIAQRLVEHNYWEVVDGGFMVHDFLDWNISKAEAMALKEAKSEAGRRGGQANVAKRQASAQASAQANPKQNSTPYPFPYQSLKEITTATIPERLSNSALFCKITNMAYIPSGSMEAVMTALDALKDKYKDDQELIAFLVPFWNSWRSRKTKDGRSFSELNCAWLTDWAAAGKIPPVSNAVPPGKNGKRAETDVSKLMETEEGKRKFRESWNLPAPAEGDKENG